MTFFNPLVVIIFLIVVNHIKQIACAPIPTCIEQESCLFADIHQVASASICIFEICIIYNADAESCRKDMNEAVTHFCFGVNGDKNTCTNNNEEFCCRQCDGSGSASDVCRDTGLHNELTCAGTVSCQHVIPEVPFIFGVKDGNGDCGSSITSSLGNSFGILFECNNGNICDGDNAEECGWNITIPKSLCIDNHKSLNSTHLTSGSARRHLSSSSEESVSSLSVPAAKSASISASAPAPASASASASSPGAKSSSVSASAEESVSSDSTASASSPAAKSASVSASVPAPESASASASSPGGKSASVSSPGGKSASASASAEKSISSNSTVSASASLSVESVSASESQEISTSAPTLSPTIAPTFNPTNDPTSSPLLDSVNCTSTHFDWDQLFVDNELKPYISHNLSINAATLSLIIDVELEYLGYAYAADHTYGYGVTYVLDFEDYDSESDDIRLPGKCQNRMRSSLINATFPELWIYSQTPSLSAHLGHAPYLAYPPSGDYWDIFMGSDQCKRIQYHGEFTWFDLLECADFDGTTLYNQVIEDANWVNLTGVFYINIVSPLARTYETGFYRAYQSLSAPFVIAVEKQVNIISSVGIDLFVITVIARISVYKRSLIDVYKDDFETVWKLIVLTESADFLQLHSPHLLSSPIIGSPFVIQNNSANTGCLSSGLLCLQLWQILISIDNDHDVACPLTNFSGTYTIQYDIECNPSAMYTNAVKLCTNYTNQYAVGVTLSASLQWIDEVCARDPTVFIVEFDGEITFYIDKTFANELSVSDQYAFGDIAYVQIVVGDTDDFRLLDLTLDNVWICTTSPDNEPLAIDDQNVGTSACLSSNIDSGFPQHIVVSGAENDATPAGNITIYTNAPNNTIWFSFHVDVAIERVNLYVQAQITLALTQSLRRRRLLQDGNEETQVSQIRHYSGVIGIESNNVNDVIVNAHHEASYAVISILIAAAAIVVCFCVFFALVYIGSRSRKIRIV